MPDNITIQAVGSTPALAADDISSVWYQRVKPVHGADGSATDVSSASPMPVNQTAGYTIKYAAITGAAGDITVVAAVTGKKIRVLSYIVTSDIAGTLRFEDGAGGTALTGAMQVPIDGVIQAGFNPGGWFETTAGTLLNLEATTAAAYGHCSYIEV